MITVLIIALIVMLHVSVAIGFGLFLTRIDSDEASDSIQRRPDYTWDGEKVL